MSKKWIGGLLLLMLLESSLINLPLLCWGVWLGYRSLGEKGSLWTGVILGLILDGLMVRTVGITSGLILAFIVGVGMARRMAEGRVELEAAAFLVVGLGWNWIVGGGNQWVWIGVLSVIGWWWRGRYKEGGIRLK